jgi:hypothetical protein
VEKKKKSKKDKSPTPAKYEKPEENSFGNVAEGEESYGEAVLTRVEDSSWIAIVNSGCSYQMFPSNSTIEDVKPLSKITKLADVKLIHAESIGTKDQLDAIDNRTLIWKNALVVPELKSSLISVTSLANDGILTVFEK